MRNMAPSGDVEGAIEKFTQAKELDAKSFSFDPKVEADRVASAQHHVTQGPDLANKGVLEGALAEYSKELDPSLKLQADQEVNRRAISYFQNTERQLVQQGKVSEALTAYAKAVATYDRAASLDLDGRSRAEIGKNLCWFGSILGHASEVMEACEEAVRRAEGLNPLNWSIRDSRGLARALADRKDAAIEDFQFFVDHTTDQTRKVQRQAWVEALRKGQNPFTPELLSQLLSQ